MLYLDIRLLKLQNPIVNMPIMKITHIEIYRYSIKMEPFAIATGTMTHAQNTYIRIYTDAEFYGVGECSAFPMIVGETQETNLLLARDFAQLWKGENPLDIASRLRELDEYIAGNATIKSAFDMALYDIAAKNAKVPLYKFLGGEIRPITTDITIGLKSAEEMAEEAFAFVQNKASILKVKLGKIPQEDIARIAKIRERIGPDIPIRIDANQGWGFEDASFVLKNLEEFNIQYCEQPMRVYNDYLVPELRKRTSIPIMADESCYNHHDAERLIRDKACDYINIKLAKSSGIHEALKIHKVASKNSIPCMIGGMLESRLALSANVHLAYACKGISFYDLDTCLVGHLEDPVVNGMSYDHFDISLPDLPGIGADVDENFVSTCEMWSI